jgi:hypothetical protein
MSPRPSAAIPRLSLAVSLLALVIALGGTAVAAGLAANSVGTKQLKKAAVTTKKIKKNAVRTTTIKNGAVTGAKVADGSLGKADLAAGVLPAAPVTISHEVPEDTDLPAVTVGGVRFQPTCRVEPGVKIAQFTIQPTTGSNTLLVTGQVLQTEGVTKTSNSIVGTGSNSFEPAASASAGNAATTTFEGVARSGSGPWVRISIGMRANTVQPNCTLRAVVDVLG